jgi:hypothetical protein
MSFRIYEYGVHASIAHGRTDGKNSVTMKFPNPVVYYLRDTENTPKEFTIGVEFPNIKKVEGNTVYYTVPAKRVRDYTPEDIRKDYMPLLLPFYTLNHMGKLTEKTKDKLRKDLVEATRVLEEMAEAGDLSPKEAQAMEKNLYDLTVEIVEKSNMIEESKERLVNDMKAATAELKSKYGYPVNYLQVFDDIDELRERAARAEQEKLRAEQEKLRAEQEKRRAEKAEQEKLRAEQEKRRAEQEKQNAIIKLLARGNSLADIKEIFSDVSEKWLEDIANKNRDDS